MSKLKTEEAIPDGYSVLQNHARFIICKMQSFKRVETKFVLICQSRVSSNPEKQMMRLTQILFSFYFVPGIVLGTVGKGKF